MSTAAGDSGSAPWSIYLIRCRGGEIYTGVCVDVARRFEQHSGGGAKAAKFVRGRGPLKLLVSHVVGSRSLALRLEYRVKRLRRAQKMALVTDSSAIDHLLDQLRDNG